MKWIDYMKHSLGTISIRKKLILFYIIFILIPTSFGMIIYYKKTTKISGNEINQSILQTLDQAEINITYRLENALDYSNILTYNANFYPLLTNKRTKSDFQQWEDFIELKKMLDSIPFNPNLYGIRLFVDPSLNYSRERQQIFSLKDIESEKWYKESLNQKGTVFWNNTSFQEYIGKDDRFVISCARILRSPNKFDQIVGALLIDIYEEDIYNIISNISLKRGQSVYIVDDEGLVISHKNKRLLGKSILDPIKIESLTHSKKGVFKETVGENESYLIYKQIPLTNWFLLTEIPISEFSPSTATLNKISGIVLLVGTFVLFILILILGIASAAQRTNKRIQDMIQVLNTEGLTGIDKGFKSESGDLTKLEKNISGIVGTVKSLTAESFQSKLKEKEASLKALQAQINPHFLYNTLDTINWMAIRKNDREISHMIISLSKYFRLSLNKGKDIVTVADEINLAKAYINIQKGGFEDSFEAKFEIAEEVTQHLIPKLTLQPIIENGLIHGIQRRKDKKGIIKIGASIDEDNLIFVITDNGPGMNTSQLKLLSRNIKDASGYGLYNVNERIQIFFNGNSELQIESQEGIGTIVKIKLKIVS